MNPEITLMTYYFTLENPTETGSGINTVDVEYRKMGNEEPKIEFNKSIKTNKQISINGIYQRNVKKDTWIMIKNFHEGFSITTTDIVTPIFKYNTHKIKITERDYSLDFEIL